jgi:hypothetical protein
LFGGGEMKTEAQELVGLSGFYSRIKSPQAREAFCLLLGYASCLNGYEVKIKPQGELMSVGIYQDHVCPFAFTVNERWLLFYFRKSAVLSKRYSDAELRRAFDSYKVAQDDEWTVRLRSVDDVRRLIPILALSL